MYPLERSGIIILYNIKSKINVGRYTPHTNNKLHETDETIIPIIIIYTIKRVVIVSIHNTHTLI